MTLDEYEEEWELINDLKGEVDELIEGFLPTLKMVEKELNNLVVMNEHGDRIYEYITLDAKQVEEHLKELKKALKLAQDYTYDEIQELEDE